MKRVLLTEIKGKDVTEHVMTEQVGNVIKGYITVNGKFERTFEQELNLSPENLALNFLFRGPAAPLGSWAVCPGLT